MSYWDYADDVAEDAAYEDAYWREQEADERWEEQQRQRDAVFDAQLDAYQAREAELADQRAAQGDVEARRPDADRLATTFGEVRVGDFMTMEDGEHARWVKVTKVEPERRQMSKEPAPGWVTLTFQTPQPLGVGYHDEWVIEREGHEAVTVDAKARSST